ncbi:hypothetical protein MES5069_1360010 [Mesorhizobium escarrei]|uniref:Uncharacterized protein n=1 Tax=Mesorhizobium escarrei TaxID=666018 RepID=A0ABN8JEH8_9HYPH|nr:hypothetical protein MES5069_1360010 [Mesorhizobium escarrei]
MIRFWAPVQRSSQPNGPNVSASASRSHQGLSTLTIRRWQQETGGEAIREADGIGFEDAKSLAAACSPPPPSLITDTSSEIEELLS